MGSSVEIWKLECNVEIRGLTKKTIKMIKITVIRIRKIRFNYFTEKKSDLIETLKIINRISNYDRHNFNISSRITNLLSRQILKTKSINQ